MSEAGAAGTSAAAGRRLFGRLLLFNLLTVVVVTIVPHFVFYHIFQSNYVKELNNLNMQTVRQFQNAIDEPVLRAVVNFPNQYLSELDSNETLVYPFSHDIGSDSAFILKVARRIADIQDNTPFLHSIDLYYRPGNLLFLGDRVCMLSETACDAGARTDWFAPFTTTDANIDWLGSRPAGPFDPSLIASYVRSIPYFGSKDIRQGIVSVNIDLAELSRELLRLKPPNEGWLLIVDERGGLIASSQAGQPMADAEWRTFADKLLAMDRTGMFTDKLAGEASVVSFAQSEYNGWRYVSVTSVESFYAKANRIRGWLAAAGGAFLAFNVLVSILLTKGAHKPISSRMNSLQTSLDKYRPVVRHNYIFRLLHGSGADGSGWHDIRPSLATRTDEDRVRGFVLRLRAPGDTAAADRTAAAYQLIERLEGADPRCPVWAIQDEASEIAGVVHYREPEPLSELIRRITGTIESQFPDRYVLCIGNGHPATEEGIAHSFAEAREALPYAFLRPEARVILHEELHIARLKHSGSSVKVLDDIASSLRSGDEKRLRRLIGEVLGDIRTGDYAVAYCRNMLLDVVSTVRKTVKGMGFSSTELFGGDIREQFGAIEHIDQFATWIHRIAETAIARIQERRQQVDPEFVQRVVKFVHDNLYNQLSLDRVAEFANVSPTTFSKLFKTMTGTNFSDYVTELKLEQAAKLLREKELSVQDISTRIGYHSTHHFIRLFKEKYGQTPKQYQKSAPPEATDADEQ